MRTLLGILAITVAAAFVPSPALALSPDDAIFLTQEGVEDEIIIAKICMDAVAWDLTAEEILEVREAGVSREVVQALIDPASAAERYGFTLGSTEDEPEEYPDNYSKGTTRTSLVFSFGYYYGPLGVHYLYDPYFYPYYCSPNWGFSFAYWPAYYRATYFPYHWGYYAYPYYFYNTGSYYCGYPYYGPAYVHYTPAPLPAPYVGYVKTPVRYRDYAYTNPPPAYGSQKPNAPEQRFDGKGRPVLDQYVRNGQRSDDRLETIRGDKRSPESVRGVDGRSAQVIRGDQKRDGRSDQTIGRGTAAERHLASRDATNLGRGSKRAPARSDQTVRVIRPKRNDGAQAVSGGRASIGTPRVIATPQRAVSARSDQRAHLRPQSRSVAPRRSATPQATRGQAPAVIRGSGRAAPAPKGKAVQAPAKSAPEAKAPKVERKAEPQKAPPAKAERSKRSERKK